MSTKAMMAALKGKVLADLAVAHEDALRKAPAATKVETTGKVDLEGQRFDNRLAQDRAEGGHGFVMSANSIGDSYFAREQREAARLADKHQRQEEAGQLSTFHQHRYALSVTYHACALQQAWYVAYAHSEWLCSHLIAQGNARCKDATRRGGQCSQCHQS